MNRIEQHPRAENPQVGNAGQPFLRQDQPDHGRGRAGHADHQRRHQVGAGHDRPAGHGLHPGPPFLLPGHGRQQHAVDGGVHIGRDHLGKQLAPVVEGQVLRGVHLADDQRPQLVVRRVQQRRGQQLPSVGKQTLQPGKGKLPFRMPFHRQAEDHRVRQHVEQLLGHQRPYAHSPVGHRDADHRGAEGAAQGGEEKLPELHVPGHIGLVYVLDAGNNDLQPQHPQQDAQLFPFVKPGNQRGRQVQHPVQQDAQRQVEPENAGKIQLIRVFFLDQGVPQPAVHKHVEHRDEHGDQRDHPILFRQEDPGQQQLHQQLDPLGADALRQPPQEISRHRSGAARRFCPVHFRILRTAFLIALKGPGAMVRIRSSIRQSRGWSS